MEHENKKRRVILAEAENVTVALDLCNMNPHAKAQIKQIVSGVLCLCGECKKELCPNECPIYAMLVKVQNKV